MFGRRLRLAHPVSRGVTATTQPEPAKERAARPGDGARGHPACDPLRDAHTGDESDNILDVPDVAVVRDAALFVERKLGVDVQLEVEGAGYRQ